MKNCKRCRKWQARAERDVATTSVLKKDIKLLRRTITTLHVNSIRMNRQWHRDYARLQDMIKRLADEAVV